MTVINVLLAPPVGRLTDRTHLRYVAGTGLLCIIVALVRLAAVLDPDVPIWQLLLPIALLGVANSMMWAPISSTATRNLPMTHAGAGSGIYNTSRQIGGLLGSAAITAVMQTRLAALAPAASGGGSPETGSGPLPPALHAAYSTAMSQSLLVPAAVLVVGLAAVLCFAAPTHLRTGQRGPRPTNDTLAGR
ncbi:MFS transporter [Saccharothrix deserti]|uniref:MFS transporter n=1 Tax=Saccharothrix deserti TaxID=2593674 RepID=UPI00131C4548|nr:MFS transporter [Saccharothrix deserti]